VSRAFALLSLLVGLGLLFGFGWLAVDSGLDAAAFPREPKVMSLTELAGLRHTPRGTWVKLVGPFHVDLGPVQPSEGGPSYVLLSDPLRTARLVVAREFPVELARSSPGPSSPPQWSGVPAVYRTHSKGSYPDLPHGLAFDEAPWSGSDPPLVILWTYSGPENSRLGLVLAPFFALLGLFVMAYAWSNLRPKPDTADAVWTGDALPQSVRLGPKAGRKLQTYASVLLALGLVWLGAFGSLLWTRGQLGPSSAHLLGVGVVLLVLGVALGAQARRVAGHDYFAALVWLPVRQSRAVRSEGIATGVLAYELEVPAGIQPSSLTAHSSPLHGGLVFKSAARTEVLAARPLHSTDLVVLSSTLDEIRENPLAPLAHPRHRLTRIA
jgi:hypothetical protein